MGGCGCSTDTLLLEQGTTRVIRAYDIVDADGNQLLVDGWSVLAQARPNQISDIVWATWVSGAPGSGQLQAIATGDEVHLLVSYTDSATWNDWAGRDAYVGIEITEPGPGGRRERFDLSVHLKPDPVHTP